MTRYTKKILSSESKYLHLDSTSPFSPDQMFDIIRKKSNKLEDLVLFLGPDEKSINLVCTTKLLSYKIKDFLDKSYDN